MQFSEREVQISHEIIFKRNGMSPHIEVIDYSFRGNQQESVSYLPRVFSLRDR